MLGNLGSKILKAPAALAGQPQLHVGVASRDVAEGGQEHVESLSWFSGADEEYVAGRGRKLIGPQE
jgi:hypothetical protein